MVDPVARGGARSGAVDGPGTDHVRDHLLEAMRQLYRHYRPVQVSEDTGIDEDLDDETLDPPSTRNSVPTMRRTHSTEFEGWSAASKNSCPRSPAKSRRGRRSNVARAGRPWSGRPAAKVPDDLSESRLDDLVPNVYSIDSTAWSARGNKRWQDAHPDAWEDADRWLADALTPRARDPRVA